jgi:RHS repeat-associated protein
LISPELLKKSPTLNPLEGKYFVHLFQMQPFKNRIAPNFFATQNLSSGYRYSFNGMEDDGEIKGEGNSHSTYFRQLDTRVGRWLSLDPKKRQFESPYVLAGNSPIYFSDPLGDTTFHSKTTGSKNVIIIVVDGDDKAEGVLSGITNVSTSGDWDYVVTDDFDEAATWVTSNYGEGSIDNLVIRTHGAYTSMDGNAKYHEGGMQIATENGQTGALVPSNIIEGNGGKIQREAITSMELMFTRISDNGSILFAACEMGVNRKEDQSGNYKINYNMGLALYGLTPDTFVGRIYMNSNSTSLTGNLENDNPEGNLTPVNRADDRSEGWIVVSGAASMGGTRNSPAIVASKADIALKLAGGGERKKLK